MSSEFGKKLRVSVFGESHGEAVGVTIQGLPAGESIDLAELGLFMKRRRPGGELSSARSEEDKPVFLSGIADGKTCGSPLCAVIYNRDARPGDYAGFVDTPRPSHADYTAHVKWNGAADMRGGGHFSGRLTAPLCIAGGVALQILSRRGIHIGAHLSSVGETDDVSFPIYPDERLFGDLAEREIPMIDEACAARAAEEISAARADGDSVGGVVECAVCGLPAGLGEPMFDGMESVLSHALFGIPGVKGVEFGSGFSGSRRRGSINNDPFIMTPDGVRTEKNDSGGILGGITTGMPIVLRAAFKPTPSIAKTQRTVSLSRGENASISIAGRHDPCIALRAVPVVEAVTAAVILDILSGGL